MWPWLIMPIAALTLYFVLSEVRQSAPQNPADSRPTPTSAEAPDSAAEP